MRSRRMKNFSIIALTIAILTTAFLAASQAADPSDAELAAMLYRNCAPNGYDRSPELYLVYYPDVLTSSGPDAAFACSHGFPWEEDTRVPLIFFGRGIFRGTDLPRSCLPSLYHRYDLREVADQAVFFTTKGTKNTKKQ